MSWRRVAWAVGVAALATLVGLSQPNLGGVLLFPATLVSRALGGSEGVFGGSWIAVFLEIYAQVFAWALAAELVRMLWTRLPQK